VLRASLRVSSKFGGKIRSSGMAPAGVAAAPA
jgi:hypothetical protein